MYINPLAWPRPSISASPNLWNRMPHPFPFLARVPSPPDSRYARYDSPRAFSASPSPCAFAFPSGSRTHLGSRDYPSDSPVWTCRPRYTAYPVVVAPAKLRSARWCYAFKNIHRLQSSLARSMVPNNVPYCFSTFGIQGWVQIFL